MPTRRLVALLAAGLLPLALTACGAGKSPDTYEQRPTVDAAQASMGDLQLRNVHVLPPTGDATGFAAGDNATVTASIVDEGEAPDRLIEATSDAATTVRLLDKNGNPTDRVDIPGQGAVGPQDFSIELGGLTQALQPGQQVPLTLAFVRAGRKTLSVPVMVYTSPVPRPTNNVFEVPEGSSAEG